MSELPAATARVTPPKQSRSRRTLERLVGAAMEIIAEEGAEALTVQAVVRRADSSVGSFYARFKGKDDLVEYLGERVWRDAADRWREALDREEWASLELTTLVESALRLLVEAQRSRAAYLKAIDRARGKSGDGYSTFRRMVVDGLTEILLGRAEELSHPTPEVAVRLGLTAVATVIEQGLEEPIGGLDDDGLVRECRVLLMGYLAKLDDDPGETEVEFFDVWG